MIPELTEQKAHRAFESDMLGFECPYCHALYSPGVFLFDKKLKGDMQCDFCHKDWVKE